MIVVEGLFALKTVGESMYPSLTEGMTIIARKSNNLNKGDIIIFKKEKGLIAHRIIEIQGDKIITKGDNIKKPDPYTIRENDVLGKAISIQDHNGNFREVPGPHNPGASRTIKESLINILKSFNSTSLYNLYISTLVPFVRYNKSKRPLLNFKKQFFFNGSRRFSRPKECLNFELFSIAVASILKFNDIDPIIYIRSAFEENRRIRKLISRLIGTRTYLQK